MSIIILKLCSPVVIKLKEIMEEAEAEINDFKENQRKRWVPLQQYFWFLDVCIKDDLLLHCNYVWVLFKKKPKTNFFGFYLQLKYWKNIIISIFFCHYIFFLTDEIIDLYFVKLL